MNFIKSTLIICLSLFFLTNCNGQKWDKIDGNGNYIKTTRKVDSYDIIKLSGDIDFILVEGKEGTINLEGDSNLLDNIEVTTENNTLSIKTKNGVYFKYSKSNAIKVTIPVSEISEITLSGSGDLTSTISLKSNKFNAEVTGSGDMKLNIEASTITTSVTGSGDLTLNGKTNNLTCKVTGSGDFHGKKLNSNKTDVKITGSGSANVVANQALKARIIGSGDIDYTGNPTKLDTKILGSGDISN